LLKYRQIYVNFGNIGIGGQLNIGNWPNISENIGSVLKNDIGRPLIPDSLKGN